MKSKKFKEVVFIAKEIQDWCKAKKSCNRCHFNKSGYCCLTPDGIALDEVKIK
ncbi:hypothetical protein [Pectinatus frisingensis]|uniref:hypothetical protein n=1 Tax=Pectinatus frisingensis TaxID=865 RepID=UPI0018C816D4|nr:hypothetical protein [Pectinatus frisingensis]